MYAARANLERELAETKCCIEAEVAVVGSSKKGVSVIRGN
jgi:hypothetical protein